jgi:hypothetical protein
MAEDAGESLGFEVVIPGLTRDPVAFVDLPIWLFTAQSPEKMSIFGDSLTSLAAPKLATRLVCERHWIPGQARDDSHWMHVFCGK